MLPTLNLINRSVVGASAGCKLSESNVLAALKSTDLRPVPETGDAADAWRNLNGLVTAGDSPATAAATVGSISSGDLLLDLTCLLNSRSPRNSSSVSDLLLAS